MGINKASLIMLEGNHQLDATIVVSLAILLSSAGETHMHKMPGPKVRLMVTQAVAIRAGVMVMVVVMSRQWLSPCYGYPISNRGI